MMTKAWGARGDGVGAGTVVVTMEALEPRWLLSDSTYGPMPANTVVTSAPVMYGPANAAVIVAADGDADVIRFGSFDGRKNVKATVTAANGMSVTFTLSGGGFGEIYGGAALSTVVLSDTTTSSVLTITSKEATVGTIVSDGPLKSITAKNIDLANGAVLAGGVLNVRVNNVVGGEQTLYVGSFPKSGAKTTYRFGQVYDLSLVSAMPIKSITAVEWRDTGGAYDTISAPSLGSLKITGDKKRGIGGNFEASLVLGNVLQPARINGGGTIVGSLVGLHLGPEAFVLRDGQLVKLGTLGGTHSMAIGVSNTGLVVGRADTGEFVSGRAVGHAFLWNGTTLRDLGTLGGSNSTAFDVNNAGWVVGNAELNTTDALGNAISHAFLWRDGVMTDLGALEGTHSEATAINNNGTIVGRTQTLVVEGVSYAYPSRPFLWSDGTMVLLPTLGGAQGFAMDVNDHDVAVGWANTGGAVGGVATSHAVLWRDGQAVDLGTLGGQQSAAFGINNGGQVVGWSETGRVDYQGRAILHAFLWDNGVMTDLGVELVGDDQAQAYISINDAGVIVGYTPDGAFRYEGGRVTTVRADGEAKSLTSAKVAGSVGYSQWLFAGSVGSVTVNGMADTWRFHAADDVKGIKIGWGNRSVITASGTVGTFSAVEWTGGRFVAGAVNTFKTTGNAKAGFSGDMTGDLQVSGRMGTVTATGFVSGRWEAGAIKSMTVRGAVTGLELRLHDGPSGKALTLGKLTVNGMMTQTNVLSAGSIGTVSVKGTRNVAIYAGVDSRAAIVDADRDGVADLPLPEAFVAEAGIKNVKITRAAGLDDSVVNTNIGGGHVGMVTLTAVRFENGGRLFGVSTRTLTRVAVRESTVLIAWPGKTGVKTIQEDDFIIRIL